MGQAECINIFEEKKEEWLSTKDMEKILNQSNSVINSSVKRLYKQKLVSRRKIKIGWYSIFQYKLR